MTARITRPHLKVGRPTTFKEHYSEQLVSFCRKGYSLTAFADELDIHRSQLNTWMEEHPAFCEAVEIAKAARLRFFEEKAINMVGASGLDRPSGGQATLAMFMLKNHGPDEFRDRQEINVSGTVNIDALLTLADERAQPKLAGESAKVIEHDAANSTESAAADQHLASQPDTT